MVFFFNQVCSALELAGNFKMKHVSRVESAGIWNESSKTWNGAIGELVNDKADIVRYLYERSYKRIKAVDFTATLLKVNVCLFVKKSTTKVLLLRSGYTKVDTRKKIIIESRKRVYLFIFRTTIYLIQENLLDVM